MGLGGLHRLDGIPQTGALAPTQRVGGFVFHADDQGGGPHLADRLGGRASGELVVQLGFVAEQQKAQLQAGHPGERDGDRRDDDRGAVIAPHGVD